MKIDQTMQSGPRAHLHPTDSSPHGQPIWFVIVIVGLSFFPYAAFPVSTSFGLQVASILVLAAIGPALRAQHSHRVLVAFYAWMLPPVVSLAIGLSLDRFPTPSVAIKSTLILLLCISTILIVPILLRNRSALAALLVVLSISIAVHATAALIQYFAYRRGAFPFLDIFANNPSFASYDALGTTYTLYLQRVFGLFPEPSAMAAVLGPWLVMSIGVLRLDKHTLDYLKLSNKFLRTGMWISVVIGLILIASSGTGYSIPLVFLAGAAALFPAARNVHTRKRPRIFLTLAVAASLTTLAVTQLQGRGSGLSTTSWADRRESMVLAIESLNKSPYALLVGVGPGQSPSAIVHIASQSFGLTTAPSAVFSFLLRYASESGIFGIVSVSLVGIYIWRRMNDSRAPVLGHLVLVAWITSFGISTSYTELLPLWILFGIMLYWDHFFPTEDTQAGPLNVGLIGDPSNRLLPGA